MNIPLIYFAILASALMMLALSRRHWLAGIWIVSFLVFPTVQTRVAGAPIYLYDAISVMLIISFVFSGETNRWPKGIPRWHWWFIGAAFVLSVFFGAIRFGLLPNLVWIWGHTSLAWIAFAFGIIYSTSEQRGQYRDALQWGLLASASAFCIIGVVQFIDIPGADSISSFFYGDIGAVKSVEILRLGASTNRATGPHFAPTGFGGVALLAIISGWLLTDKSQRRRQTLLIALFSITILCTVSRHIMLAAMIGVIVLICLSDARTNFKAIGVTLLLGLAISTSTLGLITKEGWLNRIAKWDGGILNDDNIAARLLWGPERLASFIKEHPTTLITGAGLDIEKVTKRSNIKNFEGGFVSNGFLLSLYYLGIIGFILYALFWLWSFNIARLSHPDKRGPLIAAVVVQIVIVASDNYSFLHEPAVCLLFLNSGLLAGNRHMEMIEKEEEEEFMDEEQYASEELTTEEYA